MRITKNFRADQDIIKRFLDVLGSGSLAVGHSKRATPGFFVFAHSFIRDFVDTGFFKKEDLLIKALEDAGFSPDDGPTHALRVEQQKSRAAAELLINAAKQWQAGDEGARGEVIWASSEYTSVFRQHLDRLKNLIFPLLEQSISPEDEHQLAEGFNKIILESTMLGDADKHVKQIEELEEELSDWR